MLSEFRKLSQSKSTFFCFTPVVSLATFLIEFGFAFYILYRYRATTFSRICIATLLGLGLFQLSEYLICTAYSPVWIYMGYVAITLLPAFGLHLVAIMTNRHRLLMYFSYAMAAGLIFIVLFVPQLELKAICQPHFVEIFNSPWFGKLHMFYYVFFQLAAMYVLWYSMQKHIGDTKEEKWTLIAYVVFITPTMVLYYLKVISDLSLPSVMCGFAILVSIILTLVIIPRYYQVLESRGKGKGVRGKTKKRK